MIIILAGVIEAKRVVFLRAAALVAVLASELLHLPDKPAGVVRGSATFVLPPF